MPQLWEYSKETWNRVLREDFRTCWPQRHTKPWARSLCRQLIQALRETKP